MKFPLFFHFLIRLNNKKTSHIVMRKKWNRSWREIFISDYRSFKNWRDFSFRSKPLLRSNKKKKKKENNDKSKANTQKNIASHCSFFFFFWNPCWRLTKQKPDPNFFTKAALPRLYIFETMFNLLIPIWCIIQMVFLEWGSLSPEKLKRIYLPSGNYELY